MKIIELDDLPKNFLFVAIQFNNHFRQLNDAKMIDRLSYYQTS